MVCHMVHVMWHVAGSGDMILHTSTCTFNLYTCTCIIIHQHGFYPYKGTCTCTCIVLYVLNKVMGNKVVWLVLSVANPYPPNFQQSLYTGRPYW